MSQLSSGSRVLIVGGGPVGLMMAILLARMGHRSLIIEKRLPREASAPKAHVLNPRSLEICRAVGLNVDAMREISAHDPDGNCARFMTTLSGTEFGSLPLDGDVTEANAPTPTPLLNLAQPLFESVLQRYAETLPEIEIRRGHAFIGCESHSDGVTAEIESAEGSYAESATYLIGADGANSAVRDHLKIGLDGIAAIRPRITIHFEANLQHLVGDRPAVLYWILDPDAHGTFIAYDIARTWVYTPRTAPEAFDRADYTEAHCVNMIRKAIGNSDADIRVKHVVPWMMSAQVADKYRMGRCFLVGDAAHRFPPTGGFGLNTGLQDAHNLAWKLATVMEGRASPDLLASYETERKPVAQINTAQSLHNSQKLGGLFQLAATALADGPASPQDHIALAQEIETHREHFLSQGLQLGFCYGPPVRGPLDPQHYTPSLERGARLPHAWFNVSGQRRSTLDVVDLKRFTLLAAEPANGWAALAANLPDCRLATIPADATFEADWLGLAVLRRGGALLVRPDGHIAHVGAADDPASHAALGVAYESFGLAPQTAVVGALNIR